MGGELGPSFTESIEDVSGRPFSKDEVTRPVPKKRVRIESVRDITDIVLTPESIEARMSADEPTGDEAECCGELTLCLSSGNKLDILFAAKAAPGDLNVETMADPDQSMSYSANEEDVSAAVPQPKLVICMTSRNQLDMAYGIQASLVEEPPSFAKDAQLTKKQWKANGNLSFFKRSKGRKGTPVAVRLHRLIKFDFADTATFNHCYAIDPKSQQSPLIDTCDCSTDTSDAVSVPKRSRSRKWTPKKLTVPNDDTSSLIDTEILVKRHKQVTFVKKVSFPIDDEACE